MTKSELINQLAEKQPQLDYKDVELAVKEMLEQMSSVLARGERIEVRGFGSFSLHYREPRYVHVSDKYVPHFKPGKELRDRVDGSED